MQLEALSSDVTRLNNLAGQVAADSSLATFLLQNLRPTYALSGAVEEDHRQLGVLEDEVNRTVVLIDRLLNELANDVNRQISYLATERANLQTLQLGITNGQLYGGNLSNRVSGGGPAPLAAPPRPVTPVNIGPSAEQRPLVVIHMGNGPVDYQQQVYRAVSQALDHRPNATFDLVAVSPNAGSAAEIALAASSARSGADNVKRTLISMGLPAGRITVASAARNDVTGSEVRLYLR